MLSDGCSNDSLVSSKIAAKLDSTTKRGPRTRNFSTDEDSLLVASWLNVSLVSLEGKQGKSEAYWNRMWKYFHKEKTFTSERSAVSLKQRWSQIQLAVKKFCGYYAELEVQRGANEQDRIIQAMEMYLQMQGHAFQYLHCWHALKDNKKWVVEISKRMSKVRKTVSPATSPSTPVSINLRDDDVASDISISVDLERPPGIMPTENTRNADPNYTFPNTGYMLVDEHSNKAHESSQIPAQIESTTKMEERSCNFSIDEDNLLVFGWLNASLDADNEEEQKGGAYWKRIWAYFHKEKKFTFERTADSLMHRWSAIQLAVNKFCEYHAQIKPMQQSGVSDENMILQAMEMYQQMQGHAFQFLHCWQVLKHNRKWMVDSSRKRPKHNKNASPATSSPMSDWMNLTEDDDVSDTCIRLERPLPLDRMGRKTLLRKEKIKDIVHGNSPMHVDNVTQEFRTEKKELERQKNEMFRLRYAQDQELISIKREKIRMEQLKEEERIMLIDTTGLPQMQAEYYKIRQKEIMAKRVGGSLCW